LETGCAAHENPLSIVISTQAATDDDLLSILIDDALTGHDPRVVVSLYTAPMDADPFDVETIKLANPAFADFQNDRELIDYAASVQRMPSKENEYRNLYLNQRIQIHNPFVSRSIWDACGGEPEPFGDEPVYAGLDLSSTTDLTACVLTFQRDGIRHVHPYFWLPEQDLAAKSLKDRVPYDLWAQQGHLRTTPGSSVDYEYVVSELAGIFDDLNLALVAFDRWRIKFFEKELERAGYDWPMQEWGQGYQSMSPALDVLEKDLVNARLRHGMHPVLTMCAANAVVTRSPAGDRKLDKSKANGRIDGMQALAMSCGVANQEPAEMYAVGRLVAL
jgi:phage terminase large subunit-like protein